ncbi:MAG: TolC family protein [Bacteroidales bacterium]|nr:TolC family protein [Bacteroidales bacterium]
MRTNTFYRSIVLAAAILLPASGYLIAQEKRNLSLDDAVNLALEKNHLLNIKKLAVEEKRQKINEDRVKYLPVIGIGGTYQYNSNLQELTIEQGRFGELPFGGVMIPLPATNEVFSLGNHNVYNAGITLYQPLTQLGKINAGVRYSRTEMEIAAAEEARAAILVRQGVEKLFFGLLIVQKQIEEAGYREAMAESRLHDARSALAAGKTIETGIYGLSAALADEQQSLLKLRMQYDDYSADLMQLTGLDPSVTIVPEPVVEGDFVKNHAGADTATGTGTAENYDLKLAKLTSVKADNSIRASKFSYMPDLGILGGYTYQEGIDIYPKNNTYIGASLKWNLNDVLSNRMVQKQRILSKQQADENILNIREQVDRDIAKARRKLRHSEELISVAGKVLEYRREDLKVQSDRRSSGLSLESDLLAAKASLAKAESDLYAAQLNYRMALSELKILTGTN